MTNSQVSLRPEKASDESFLRKLFATTRVDVTFSSLPPEQKQQFLRMQFDAQRYHYRTHYSRAEFSVIEQNGRAAGRLYVAPLEEEIRVIDITLMPAYRGKGIGTQLLRDVQDRARSMRLPVTLHAEKMGNMAEYYKRLGFEVVSELEAHFFMKWTSGSSIIVT